MITVEMTVREAMNLVSNGVALDMYERIVQALEAKCGELRCVMTVHNVPRDNFLPVIKVLRSHLGWGLKEAKDWLDVIRGNWDSYQNDYINGRCNSLVDTSDVIVKLASDLRSKGCRVEITNV